MEICKRVGLSILAVWSIVAIPAAGRAQSSVTVGSVTAVPGEANAVVSVDATTDVPASLVSLDITFPADLCADIGNVRLRRAGRTTADPLEGGFHCPEGRLSVVLADLLGGTVVPAGSGPIAEWVFDVSPAAAERSIALELTVNELRNGPLQVPVTPSSGQLAIIAATPTATAEGSTTPTATSPPATPSPSESPSSPTPTSATPTPGGPSPTRTNAVDTPTASPSASPAASEGSPTASATAAETVTPAPLYGDANCDGLRTAPDVTRLLQLVGTGGDSPCGLADANGDGHLDANDLAPTVASIFGSP